LEPTKKEAALELITRMESLLTSTTRTPYGYNNIYEWRKTVETKIKEIKNKEGIK